MPTVIDSLVLELGLDPKNFSQGQREAMDQLRKFQEQAVKTGKDIETQQRRAGEGFAALKREALGFLGVAFGGAAARRFLDYVTDLDAAIGRNARTLDISTRELSAWQGAAEATGGSAAGVTGAMQGLSGAMQNLLLTGNASFVPVFNQMGISLYKANGQLKTSAELMMDLSRAVEGMDPARARALLSMVPGMNEESINLILRGRRGLEELLDTMRRAGVTSEADAAAAQKFNEQLTILERTAIQAGRSMVQNLLPGLSKFLELYGKVMQMWNNAPAWVKLLSAPLNPVEAAGTAFGGLANRFGGGGGAGAATATPTGGGGDQEAYIRAAAARRGIDPNVAVAVARSEGLGGAYAGDRGSSFGPFQLHYGGMAGGGMAVGGLGDEFTRQTGLDARDPSTWRQQVDFALDQAKAHGWGPWHGWRGAPTAGISANNSFVSHSRGGDTNSNSLTINGGINVSGAGRDAGQIAGDLGAAIQRQNLAAPFNTGAQ